MAGEYNGVHTFLKDINLKINSKARLEFEFADNDFVVQHFSHYTWIVRIA